MGTPPVCGADAAGGSVCGGGAVGLLGWSSKETWCLLVFCCAVLMLVISGSGCRCVGAELRGVDGIGMFGVCELGWLVAVGGDWFGLAGTVLLCIVC